MIILYKFFLELSCHLQLTNALDTKECKLKKIHIKINFKRAKFLRLYLFVFKIIIIKINIKILLITITGALQTGKKMVIKLISYKYIYVYILVILFCF